MSNDSLEEDENKGPLKNLETPGIKIAMSLGCTGINISNIFFLQVEFQNTAVTFKKVEVCILVENTKLPFLNLFVCV